MNGRLVGSVAGFAAAIGMLLTPTVIDAAAQQIVFELVDEEAPWEFDDPCTGIAVHGVGIENGIVRITELGDKGHHVRVAVTGVADLYDDEDNLVGTWTYRLRFTDQVPPGGQGAVHMTASGPVAFATGGNAILHVFHRHVFAKGDVEKFPARDTAVCDGRRLVPTTTW
jgi:hypothetical protein